MASCGSHGEPPPAGSQSTQAAQRAQGSQRSPAPAADERGAVLKKEAKGSASLEEAGAVASRFLVSGNALPPKHAVDWYRIEYQSTDREEKPLRVVGQLFVPKSDQASSMPVYVFGPGTTGLNDQCAPSAEQPGTRSWGDFQSHLITYAAQGYVAVMPDYEGFNDGPRLHHYYVGEQQARVMLDAARAALRFFDDGPQAGQGAAKRQNPVFISGYSHGGYVALAARDLAQKYAPELQLKGAIGYGPRSDVATLFKEMPSLGPYVLFSYANYYGGDKVPLDKIILPRWLPTLERDVTGKCIDEIVGYYGDDPGIIFTPEFISAVRQGTLAQQFPTVKQLFDQNKAGVQGQSVPVLVLHGSQDTVVEPATLQAYMKELCASGGKGQYVLYPDIPHTLIRQTGYQDALRWMEATAKGALPKNDCG